MYELLLFMEKVFAYLQGKGFGAETVNREARFALKLLGKNPKVVFDIGANEGMWTKAILDLFPLTFVHAFEPQPLCSSGLKNYFRDHVNVNVHANAVSNETSTLSLFFDFAGSGLASLTRRNLDHVGINLSNSIEVSTITLDNFIEQRQIGQIDIIKIDVEGHEMNVFEGMKKILSGPTPPIIIQFEFGGCNIDTRTFFRDFYILFDNQYEIYRQTPIGHMRISKYREADECFRTTNFFLRLKQ